MESLIIKRQTDKLLLKYEYRLPDDSIRHSVRQNL